MPKMRHTSYLESLSSEERRLLFFELVKDPEVLRDGQERAILEILKCGVKREELDECQLPKPLDLLQVATEPPPVQDWVVKNLILAGTVGVLVGEGGIGKSWFTLYLALVVSTGLFGGPFEIPRPQPVCILNFEDPPDELARRLHWLLKPYKGLLDKIRENLFVYPLYGLIAPLAQYGRNGNPEITESFTIIRKIIAARQSRLTILDTYSRCFGLNEKSNEDVAWFLSRLEGLSLEYGTAFLIVHHQNKIGRGERTAESARGATALVDNSRFALTITKLTKEEQDDLGLPLGERIFRVDSIKNNYGRPGGPWFFRLCSDVGPEPLDIANLQKDHLIQSVVKAVRIVAPNGASLRDLQRDKEFRQHLKELTGQPFTKISDQLEELLSEAATLKLLAIEEKPPVGGKGNAKKIYRPL